MLQLSNISKSFAGRVLLDNVSLQLNAGDRVGLVGVIGRVEGDRAIRECGANLLDRGLAEIQLERKRLELGRLDATALLRVGQEGINNRDIDRGGQGESFRSVVVVRARAWSACFIR